MKHQEGQITIKRMNFADIRQYNLSNLKIHIENHLITIASGFIAIVLLCVALANGFSLQAFFENEIYFVPNMDRNTFDFTYLVTAIGLLVITLQGEKKAVSFIQVIGKVYLLVSLIGFIRIGSYNFSEWTALINFALGLFMVVTSNILRDYKHSLLVAQLIEGQRQINKYLIMDTIKNSDFRYSVLKKNFHNREVYSYKDTSETNCIRGEFI